MSRHVEELIVAYGFDHVEGYYFQLYKINSEDEVEQFIIDESSLLTKMSNSKMIELMEKYKLPKSHIQKVAMDLPIEQ
tara:strand:+ start:16 stop:249 length:234 start_codon:yes stop_codon:yes gene_type:complete